MRVIQLDDNYKPRASKHNNRRTEYNGRIYMSKMEADDALWLDMLLRQKKIRHVAPQYKIDLRCNGKHITTHIVDFLVTLPDGRTKFVETKGMRQELWRIKMKLTEANYPDIPYLVNPSEKELLR